MSKEKLLASAQKNLEKGQLAKAISDYQKVVEADPRDVRNRQKLAELFSRARQNEQALGEYGAVAKYYADNGFYLKAIAVYKQMQRLDPARPDLYLRLADLNQKQGLAGNAAAEYRNLAALYEGQKRFPEAIGALEKLKELEPDNYSIRIKIFETFLRGGLQERARREFDEVLGLLREKGEFALSLRLYEMLVPLHPNDAEMKTGYGEALVRYGDVERGLQVLLALAAKDQENPRILHALAEGYRRKGDLANERSALQRGLGAHPDNLDLREAFIRNLLGAGEFGRAVEELGGWFDLLLQAGRKEALQGFCRVLLKALPDNARVQRLFSATEGVPGTPPPTADGEKEIFPAEALSATIETEEALELDAIIDLEIASPEPPVTVEAEATSVAGIVNADGDAEEFTLAELSFAEDPISAKIGPERMKAPSVSEPIAEKDSAIATPTMTRGTDSPLEMELELDLEIEFDGFSPEAAFEPAGAEEDDSDLTILDLAEEALEEAELAEELLEEAELSEDPGGAKAPDLAEEVELELCLADDIGGLHPPADDSIDLNAMLAEEEVGEGVFAATSDEIALDLPSKSKTGIRTEAVQLEDAESHFQLGIAYKEMGLLEEAEKEFKQAMRDPSRAAACIVLTGICLAERGKKEEAESAFKAGLRHPGLAENEKLTLHFELGDLYEQWGRELDALDCFQYVADHDVFLRQVGERIVDLRRRLGLDGGGQEEADAGPKGNRKRVSYI